MVPGEVPVTLRKSVLYGVTLVRDFPTMSSYTFRYTYTWACNAYKLHDVCYAPVPFLVIRKSTVLTQTKQ